MPQQHPEITRDDLFARLARGHAERLTVLTPNRRLAQSLQADFDRTQGTGKGLQSWETADVLAFGAFVERLWEDALHSELAAQVPVLLTPVQEQALWEQSIAASDLGGTLFSASAAAAQCREAWNLAHEWGLARTLARDAASEDAKAFVDWSVRYERLTRGRGLVDAARLPEIVAPFLEYASVRKPSRLVLFGFDLLTPRLKAFLQALQAQSVEVLASRNVARAPIVSRHEFASAEEELAAAARWARSRLERDPEARIGLVVPDLAHSRPRVRRALARVLQPGYLLPGAADTALPFDISLGSPLDEFPLVHAALAVLRICGRRVSFEDASRVLRSPFIAGAESEMAVRSRLDAAVRGRAGIDVTLDQLLRMIEGASVPRAPIAVECVARLAEHRKRTLFGTKTATGWARGFSEALRIAGFPGERTLDSTEFQALEKWHEVLAGFAALECVTGKMGYTEALARLARLVRETLFQPETPDVPIQVLGILESAGLALDHLWIMGLTDDAWPLPARPNPFVSLRSQREAGVPQADPISSLELDRRITQGWLQAASEVVVSHARVEEDNELAASPLIAHLPMASFAALGVEDFATLRDALHGAGSIERIRDGRAPGLEAGIQGGGTALFRDQSACPFRAFARHRLGSEGLEFPQPGLTSADRGTLLHEMMRAVWSSLETRARLERMDAAKLDELLDVCADQAIAKVRRYRHEALSGKFATLEKARLASAARAWVEVERRRDDFEVVATEDKRPVTFAGITVNARLDRMDRLSQGGRAVIDYKTGAAEVSSWLGSRPEEPQLPMYALACGEDVRAVAFARLKRGEEQFCGLAMEEGLIPGVGTIAKNRSPKAREYPDWSALQAGWRREIEALATAFRSGDARVDPKRGEQTCQRCDQHMLCRIAEKSPQSLDGGDDAEAGNP